MVAASQGRKRLFGRTQTQQTFAMQVPSAAADIQQIKDGALAPRNLRDGWVRDAYVYADTIPEVGFVIGLQASLGAQCRFLPQEFDTETREWKVTENESALRVHAAFVGPLGGQAELLRRGFMHLAIGGEALLLGTPTEEVDREYGIHWEFLSSEELVAQRGGRTVRKVDGLTAEPLNENSYVARVYRPHAMFSGLNDSPMRRVLAVCEQILDEQQLRKAITRSRLAAQIFYLPQEMEFPPILAEDGSVVEAAIPGDTKNVTAFMKRFSDHVRAPIENRASTASLVPLIMMGPAELYGKFGLVEISRDLDQLNADLRKEDLARLAAGLDIDPAILDGYSSLNHWTAAQVDAGLIAKQIRPTGELLAAQCTDWYFRAMLETFEEMSTAEAMRFRWVFDPSPIMARTDEAQSARVLFEYGPLGEDTLLKANGFDSSDKASPEERKYRLALELLRRDPVTMLPVLADYLGLANWNLDALPAPAAPGAMGGPAGPGGAPGGSSGFVPPVPQPGSPAALRGDQGRPDAPPGATEPINRPAMAMLVDRLAVSADAAIGRAKERAVGRFATKARRNEALNTRLRDVRGTAVLTMVGPADLELVNCPVDVLLEGAWDQFSIDARRWVRTHLEKSGVEALRADDVAAFAVQMLCQNLHSLVQMTLHETLPMQANGTHVPDHIIREALGNAGVT